MVNVDACYCLSNAAIFDVSLKLTFDCNFNAQMRVGRRRALAVFSQEGICPS